MSSGTCLNSWIHNVKKYSTQCNNFRNLNGISTIDSRMCLFDVWFWQEKGNLFTTQTLWEGSYTIAVSSIHAKTAKLRSCLLLFANCRNSWADFHQYSTKERRHLRTKWKLGKYSGWVGMNKVNKSIQNWLYEYRRRKEGNRLRSIKFVNTFLENQQTIQLPAKKKI
jgi:hypothetical protein